MWLWFAGMIDLVIIDQLSKLYVVANFKLHDPIAILPSLNISLAYNQGAAFGMLGTENGWQRWFFIVVAAIVSAIIIVWQARLTVKDRWESLALACILGGALGNLIDRIAYGHVVDFIDFYIGSWHWYTFNIADIAICVGAFILGIQTLRKN